MTSVKSELGVVEEKETSVGEREHDVAEKLSLGSVVDLVGSESLLFEGNDSTVSFRNSDTMKGKKSDGTNLISVDEDTQSPGGSVLSVLLGSGNVSKVRSEGSSLPDLGAEVSLVGEISDDSSDVLEDGSGDGLVGHALDEGKNGDGGGKVGDGENGEEEVESRDGGSDNISRSGRNGGGGSSGGLEDFLGGSGEGSNLKRSRRKRRRESAKSSSLVERPLKAPSDPRGGSMENSPQGKQLQ